MAVAGTNYCPNCGARREAANDTHCRRCGAAWIAPETSLSVLPRSGPEHADEERSGLLRSLRPRRPGVSSMLPVLLLALVIGGFMTADRLALHVYSPDAAANNAQVTALQNTESRDILDLQNRVSSIDKNVQNALNTQTSSTTGVLDQLMRDERIVNAVTVLSLLTAYGGQQSSNSVSGKACNNWLLFGEGSVTDCGFQHVDN